jgi:hypothetical protein
MENTPEAGSFKVGPSAGSGEWFSINAAQVNESYYFNDTFVFAANGSFSNVLELILGLRNGKVLMLTHVGHQLHMTGLQ